MGQKIPDCPQIVAGNRGGKNGPSTAKLEFDIVTALDLF